MKRIVSLILAMLVCLMPVSGFAEAAEERLAERDARLQAALNPPVSDKPTHITVGNTTKVNGAFFTTSFGNNTSDIDVRTMLHGYSPVVWSDQLRFIVDPMVVSDMRRDESRPATITITLNRDLVYCDGETPLTARDYVFSWLLMSSPEMAAIGAKTPALNVRGFDEYHSGEAQVFSGVRLLGDYQFSLTLNEGYENYFYDLAQIDLEPYPISVLAPGCAVADDGQGAYITNEDPGVESPVFTAELLEQTILDPETGYISHPMLTCGPYRLVEYDAEEGRVEFEINPYFKGNYQGVKPSITTITLVPVGTETMIDQLASGEVDLLNKCVDSDVIADGMQLASAGDDFRMQNYARLGYGFCAFSCEKGPQQFQSVRQALNYAFDSEAFVRDFLGGLGLPVYGYYGLGQWMYEAVEGSLRPSDLEDSPEVTGAWDALSLENLNTYPLDLDEAVRLLVEDGWTLNRDGGAFDPEKDDVRCKEVDGELMPLSLRFAKCKDNTAAEMVVTMFNETLPQIGAELVVEEVTFNELLSDYYRENGERRFDMNFMATNFVSTFDPYYVFSAREDMQGSVNTSGIVDDELVQRAWDMRSTPRGDLLTFLQRWILLQERFNEVLPTMPIYSNVYFDFHTSRLQNYYANVEYSWPVAILYAFYGEPAAEAPETVDGTEDIEIID